VFEFNLAGIAPGSTINSAAFEFEVSSFTRGSAGDFQLVIRAFAGDVGVSLADGNAASTLAGTGSVTALGVGQISLNPAAIQPLLGGNATIRVQNSELSGQWASLYAIEWPFANRRARLVLDVTVPAPRP
jgi:hypothetical protein